MQFFINLFVAFDIPFDFQVPKITIAFMVIFSNIPIFTMPKFTVTKYRNFRTFNNKVRFSKYRLVIFAIPYSGIPKDFSKRNFRFGSFAFVCSHILMALFFCQAIHQRF